MATEEPESRAVPDAPDAAIPPSKLKVRTDAGGGEIFAPWLDAAPAPWWFEVEAWQRRAGLLLAESGGRGRVAFLRNPFASAPASDAEQWVLRQYRRGGLVRHLVGSHYLYTGAERTRVFREVRLLHALHRYGLPVPRPVAGRYLRRGPWYAAALITERLPGAEPMSHRLAGGACLPLAVWQSVGATVRRFHDAGVWHADLNAHNILLDGAGRCFVIDFDRGRWHSRHPLAPALCRRNLDRLARSLRKIGALDGDAASDGVGGGGVGGAPAGEDPVDATAGWDACLARYYNPA